MSGNEAFELVSERGWNRGLGTMLRSGLDRWFKTKMWWVQCLIWGSLIGFILGAIAFNPQSPPAEELLMIFTIFAGIFPAVGVIIIMQDALVGEKREGTAAWVLSKPLARPAFVVSKIIANSAGILVTMVMVPCIIAFAIITISQKTSPDPLGYLEAMVVFFISHFFFLSLTLMLGTFFDNRGPVIGIPMGLLFLQQNLIGYLPKLGFVLPWNLSVSSGSTPPLVLSLMLNIPVQPDQLINLACVLVESFLFILIGLWRFNREEF